LVSDSLSLKPTPPFFRELLSSDAATAVFSPARDDARPP